jgi:DNA (cytosine-5)-methyltransferase 1
VTAAGNHHMLVRMNGTRPGAGQMCTPVSEPARTITAAGHQALVEYDTLPPAVEDCLFRMLVPSEIGRAMAFRADYRVGGTNRERVRQLGNAVTPPAAEFLFRAVAPILS